MQAHTHPLPQVVLTSCHCRVHAYRVISSDCRAHASRVISSDCSGARGYTASTVTGVPLKAAVPQRVSMVRSSVRSLMLAPACSWATAR